MHSEDKCMNTSCAFLFFSSHMLPNIHLIKLWKISTLDSFEQYFNLILKIVGNEIINCFINNTI